MGQLFVDILVTTYQRAVDLGVLMRNLEMQEYKFFQLQIFDGSFDDAVVDAVNLYLAGPRQLPYPVIFHRTSAGMTRQRNIAVDHTKGDISLFLDDDVELEPSYLSELVRLFRGRPEVAGMNGYDTRATQLRKGKVMGKRKTLYKRLGLLPEVGPARYLPWGHSTPHFNQDFASGAVEVDVLIGHNMAFRTGLLKMYRFAKFFEDYPTYVLYDDQDICLRLKKNFKLVLNYDAKMRHNVSPSGRPPKAHYGFQAFFNAYRNWKLYGNTGWRSSAKFWGWEILDILLQLSNRKSRNISIGRLSAIRYVLLGNQRYSEITVDS